MKLAQALRAMPDQVPTAREILLALIDSGHVDVAPDGGVRISFEPNDATLRALMMFDACEREDELIREEQQIIDQPSIAFARCGS